MDIAKRETYPSSGSLGLKVLGCTVVCSIAIMASSTMIIGSAVDTHRAIADFGLELT